VFEPISGRPVEVWPDDVAEKVDRSGQKFPGCYRIREAPKLVCLCVSVVVPGEGVVGCVCVLDEVDRAGPSSPRQALADPPTSPCSPTTTASRPTSAGLGWPAPAPSAHPHHHAHHVHRRRSRTNQPGTLQPGIPHRLRPDPARHPCRNPPLRPGTWASERPGLQPN